MKFVVGKNWPPSPERVALLRPDDWDDWFKFETTMVLWIRGDQGSTHRVGSLKMGQVGMVPKQRSAALPSTFDVLPETFFSLGQDESYYENLSEIGEDTRGEVLLALRDVATDLAHFEKNLDEKVMGTSLLRFVTPETVRGQFHRLSRGGARLSPYSFSYTAPKKRGAPHDPVTLAFSVTPESLPPTNVHVLIGRNGVGKTHLLNHMAMAVVEAEGDSKVSGSFVLEGDYASAGSAFANLVSVTFSAFDQFLPLPERQNKAKGVRYAYIGLKRKSGGRDSAAVGIPKSPKALANEFSKSMVVCQQGPRRQRWQRALEMLESDPVFKDVGVAELADTEEDDDELLTQGVSYFNRLSSGHKIVLLSITRLVETVEERTLVLLDEPEAHLHPPLLSAFIRSLSDLLIDRNGVAIVATHSPVILQEVPNSCAWMIRRSGMKVASDRPKSKRSARTLESSPGRFSDLR